MTGRLRSKLRSTQTRKKSAPAALPSFARPKGTVTKIFRYKGGWDEVAYSDGGAVLFVTALHCRSRKQCAGLLPMFARFVPTLQYYGNVKVIQKH